MAQALFSPEHLLEMLLKRHLIIFVEAHLDGQIIDIFAKFGGEIGIVAQAHGVLFGGNDNAVIAGQIIILLKDAIHVGMCEMVMVGISFYTDLDTEFPEIADEWTWICHAGDRQHGVGR